MATWAETLHPRNPRGAGGGEFKGDSAPKQASSTKSTGRSPHGSMSFNGRSGTGYGSKNGDPRVRKLQQALNRLGLKDANGRPLVIDGKLGPKTTAAIKRWQKRNGMTANGVISPATLAKLTAPVHKKANLTRTGGKTLTSARSRK